MKKMKIWYFINTQTQQKRIQVDIKDSNTGIIILSNQYTLGKNASETRDNNHTYIGDILADLAETNYVNTDAIEYVVYYPHKLKQATKEETKNIFDELLAEV